MKRSTVVLAALTFDLGMGVPPAFAQGRGGGRGMGGPPSGMGGPMGGMNGSPGGMGADHGAMGTSRPSSHPGSQPSTGPTSQPTTGKRTMIDILTQNTKLASKISDLTGMDAQTACSGFKNLGQCVAAAHVGKNLGIDFNTLKGKGRFGVRPSPSRLGFGFRLATPGVVAVESL